jgi:hypothetical protein
MFLSVLIGPELKPTLHFRIKLDAVGKHNLFETHTFSAIFGRMTDKSKLVPGLIGVLAPAHLGRYGRTSSEF